MDYIWRMKKKAAERYSILIVPQSRSSIKRLEVSGRLVAFLLACSFGLFAFLTASIVGLVHYRNAYRATESVRIEAANYKIESSGLYAKLATLEDTVARTGRFAAKIESVLKTGDHAQSGEGPVDEEDWIPPVTKAEEMPKVMEKAWRSPFGEHYSAKLNLKIDDLMASAAGAEEKLNGVFVLQQDRLFFWASMPSIWPTRGWITSTFGDFRPSGRGVGGHGGRWHEGIDIAAPHGTPIMASGDGLVTFSGYRSGYGNMLILDHGNGFSTVYAHCSAIFVEEGRRVNRGMIIAAVGNTGRSTGPHLHYEIHVDGVPVNPLNYIVENM
jgi:murein DD-endopeptidase MepM/ murein hydrolase activator NlpD